MNIDVSRVGTEQIKSTYGGFTPALNDGRDLENHKDWIDDSKVDGKFNTVTHEGRWPANIILDEEAGQILDEQSGISISKKQIFNAKKQQTIYGNGNGFPPLVSERGFTDKGGASRFFYCPKTSKKDRDEGLDGFEEKIVEKGGHQSMMCNKCKKQIRNVSGQCECDEPEIIDYQTPKKNHHPTVKPTALMEYLIKLVTPVNGTVMDPFMGSGSTGKASVRNGFDFIGIEREEEYMRIAEARIKNELK